MGKHIFLPFREFLPISNGFRFPLIICSYRLLMAVTCTLVVAAFVASFLFSLSNLTFSILMLAIFLVICTLILFNRVRAGSCFFLVPKDISSKTYELQMGTLAFRIYNKAPNRRIFIGDEVNNILNIAAVDPRIEKIEVVTWLLDPFPKDLPFVQNENPPCCRLIFGKPITYILALLADHHYAKLKHYDFRLSFSYNVPWYKYTWDKETLKQWYNL